MKLRRWWQRLCQRFAIGQGPGLRSGVSLDDFLLRYVTRTEYAHIVATTPDRRMLVDVVATSRGIESLDIVRKWGVERGCRSLERPACADFTVLPADVSPELLERSGATVVTSGALIEALVCVDPDTIEHLRVALGDIEIVVAPWREIERQLGESTVALAEIKAARQRESLERLRETTAAVLGIVVQEVVDRGGAAVYLDLTMEDPTYTLGESSQSGVQGSLHAMLRPTLEETLGRDIAEIELPSGVRIAATIERAAARKCFTLRWAHERSAAPTPPAVSSCPPTPDPKGIASPRLRKNVFVIEDNPSFRAILTAYIERQGFGVIPFSAATDAWSALEEGVDLDVIVCDLHMVEMSGYDFIRRLRATRVGRNVPVIALSSADDVETELQMLRAGVAAFISKGADPRILGAHIERLCLGLEGES